MPRERDDPLYEMGRHPPSPSVAFIALAAIALLAAFAAVMQWGLLWIGVGETP